MTTTVYYYSDGNLTLTGNGPEDELSFYDDINGVFDPTALSFLRSGDDLLIRTGTGSTITITNHFLYATATYESIKFYDINGNSYHTISHYSPSTIAGTAENAALTGTNGYDLIFGGTGDNVIVGNGGGDRIYGGDGNDTITVGNGSSSEDTVYAGNGDDTLYASTLGKEQLYGNAGNDTFHTHANGTGVTNFHGGTGDDTYHINITGAGANISDDSGKDTIIFSAGISFKDLSMLGAGGNHKIVADDSVTNANFSLLLLDQASETMFEKVVFDDGSTYTLNTDIAASTSLSITNPNPGYVFNWTADDNDNVIYAAGGQYNLHGGAGDDIIYGKDNDGLTDGLSGHPYPTYLFGDAGNDIIHIGTVRNSTWSGGFGFGGTGNDIIYGTDYADQLHGGDGDDIMYGGLTNGATAHDIFVGGSGDDIMHLGDTTFNTAYGDDGYDVIVAGMMPIAVAQGITTQMRGGADNDVYVFSRDDANSRIAYKTHIMDDSGSYDTIALGAGFNTGNVNLTTLNITDLNSDYYMINVNSGISGNVIERLSFSDGSVYTWNGSGYSALTGTSCNDNPVYLSAWHDVFNSLAGNDTVYALEGNDRILGNAGDDYFDGGKGNDTVDYSLSTSSVAVNLRSVSWVYDSVNTVGGNSANDGLGGTDTLISFENVIGSAHGDFIYGTGSYANIIHAGDGDDYVYTWGDDDVIYGEGGNDELIGGVGYDQIFGGTGNDTIYGYGDNDILYGEEGDDSIHGSGGDDILTGGSGIDWLYGGDGNDTLYSSGDRDHLYGDAGADTFIFDDTNTYSNLTLIHDFDLSEGDKINIADVISDFDSVNDDINDYVTLAEAGNHTYLWIDQNGTSSGGSVLLGRLTNVTGLDLDNLYTNGDIIV